MPEQLLEKDWSQLANWQHGHQAFDWNVELPSGSADIFSDYFNNSGTGMQLQSSAKQEEINNILAGVFTRISDSN
jgi:hypothetical protein